MLLQMRQSIFSDILSTRILPMEVIMSLVETLCSDILSIQKTVTSAPLIIAIDGRCGSGKSTLAGRLSILLDANVVHIDDFYLPLNHRNEHRLSELGGNIDYERFFLEVLHPLQNSLECSYQPFNCMTQELDAPHRLTPKHICIVEGAYSLLPKFQSLYSYKLFLTHNKDIQQLRLKNRVGAVRLTDFNSRWIPREEAYFDQFNIESLCDQVIDTSSLW